MANAKTQNTKQRTIGKIGERYAAKYLENMGFRILGLNVYTRYGEIDIVAVHKRVIHAIEVKTRTQRSQAFGGAAHALTSKKLQKMKKAFALIRNEKIPFISGNHQFDFIAIELGGRRKHPHIEIFWNIGDMDF